MLDDLRKTIEATIGELTPARARSLAKSLAGQGAAKDQVAKSAADLIEWSQKNRDKIKEFVRREVSSQVGAVGVATQADLDSLQKRVRSLERRAAASAGTGGKGAAAKPVGAKATASAAAAKKKAGSAAKRSSARARD